MKSIRHTAPLSLLLGGLLFLTACDGSLGADAAVELTAEEAAVVSEIAAQSVADAQEGTMSDLNDMNAGLSADGMTYGEGFIGPRGGHHNPAARLWRGLNLHHRATYNAETGEHTVSYERKVLSNLFEKSLKVNLVYVFTTAGGAFVEFPRRSRDSVNAITFTGSREGYTQFEGRTGSERRSQFAREAAWQVAGLTTGTASFEGSQDDEGVFRRTTPSGETSEHRYEAHLQTQNVVITRASVEDGIEAAVTGQLLYQITIQKTRGDDTEEKTVEGIIELEGNGQALLRILGVQHRFHIDLQSGEVVRADG